MKVLWMTNFALPSVARAIGMEERVYEGWLVGLSERLLKDKGIELFCVFPQNIKSEMVEGKCENLRYFGYPQKSNGLRYNKELLKMLENVIQKVEPEIVHINGSEYPQVFSMVQACDNAGMINSTVISIQGLVSVYTEHYWTGLPWHVKYIPTLRDAIKRQTLRHQYKEYVYQGKYEVKALQKVKNVIGRTDWDEACTTQINPQIKYYFNNETLRPVFYNAEWRLDKCQKHSIFVSQGSRTVKGLHYMLRALAIVVKQYPDACLYIAGSESFEKKRNYISQRRTAHENYIFHLISKYHLESAVHFCGTLTEIPMCEQYLRSHVFVSSSTIENSPNSLGEAMLLGVPSITSDVGGVKNLLEHEVEGFIYQCDAPYMLAYYIKKIFDSDELAKKLSLAAKEKALQLYDGDRNKSRLIQIYESISKNRKNKENK